MTNDIAGQHAQHRKARRPRIGRRGRAAVLDVQPSRAGAAQVVRVTERGVVAATEDVVADAIRSSDSGSGRDADTATRANATDACAANPGAELRSEGAKRTCRQRSDRTATASMSTNGEVGNNLG